jgi:hypothetical protein
VRVPAAAGASLHRTLAHGVAQTYSSDECHSLLFLQFLNGAALTVDIFDLAALSEVHVCGRQYFVSSSTHCAT